MHLPYGIKGVRPAPQWDDAATTRDGTYLIRITITEPPVTIRYSDYTYNRNA